MTTKTAYPIQPILAPDFGRPAELFINAPEDTPGFAGEAPWALNEGQSLSTNTYLNALFPHVWEHFAEIGDLGLTCVATGPYQIEIVAVSADESETVLVSERCLGDRKCPFAVWSGLPDKREGRLYLRIQALGDLTIDALSWVTDVPPRHDPSLSVGLCTFNREAELAETVAALCCQRLRTPEIKAVYVVNQGPSFSSENILAEVRKQGVHLIEQPNLGGCGGFTRSMLEAISADDETTHHLLMDDDIVLDPRLLDKVLHFLRYADQHTAVGGQMLEIENPTRLFEAGGKVHHRNFVEPMGKDKDIVDPSALNIFSTTPDIDYNAWWFCVVPVTAIKSVGLPPPLFIRGDDIEYGFRLKAAGITTIPLPGCPVWHESFSHKTSDWLNYYVLRNRLLFSIIYPDATRRPDALFLFGFLMTLLLVHRYRAASVALKAIEDASRDPFETLQPNSAVKHQEINVLLASMPTAPTLSAEEIQRYKLGKPRPLNTTIPAMVLMIIRSFVLLHLSRLNPWRKAKKFKFMPQAPAVGGADYYGALNKEETEFSHYKSDLRKLWSLTFRTIKICVRYSFLSPEKLKMIQKNLDELRHPDHWKKAFNAPRD